MRYNYDESPISPSHLQSKNPYEPSCGDPYKILNIPSSYNTTSEQIKKSFRQLSLQYHPDKLHLKTSLSNQQQKIFTDRYHLIQEARNFLLRDKCNRTKYDSWENRRREQIKKINCLDIARRKMKEALDTKLKKELIKKQSHNIKMNQVDNRIKKERSELFLDKLRKSGIILRENYTRNNYYAHQNEDNLIYSTRSRRANIDREKEDKLRKEKLTDFFSSIKREKLLRIMEYREDFKQNKISKKSLFDYPNYCFTHGYYSKNIREETKSSTRWDNDLDSYYPPQIPQNRIEKNEPNSSSPYLSFERLQEEERSMLMNIIEKDCHVLDIS